MNIAEKLQYYRELKGYTVNKLANLSGLSQSHVREIQLKNVSFVPRRKFLTMDKSDCTSHEGFVSLEALFSTQISPCASYLTKK